MYSRILLAAFLLATLGQTCYAHDYGNTIAKKVKAVLGANSTKHFRFASYPVNNFGVATQYNRQGTELCATWTCLANDDDIPVDAASLLSVTTKSGTRYVDVGTGGPITLTEDEKRDLGLHFVLPELLKVIKLDVLIGRDRDIKTELTLGEITIRKIIPDRVVTRINSLPADSAQRTAFNTRNLQLVYSDIVAKNMTITLNVDTSGKTDSDAQLTGALGGKVGSVVGGKDSALSVKVDSATKGKYVLSVASPVILATWTKLQPEAGHLGDDGIESWPDARISPSAVFVVGP